jgi:hypothetical protein
MYVYTHLQIFKICKKYKILDWTSRNFNFFLPKHNLSAILKYQSTFNKTLYTQMYKMLGIFFSICEKKRITVNSVPVKSCYLLFILLSLIYVLKNYGINTKF